MMPRAIQGLFGIFLGVASAAAQESGITEGDCSPVVHAGHDAKVVIQCDLTRQEAYNVANSNLDLVIASLEQLALAKDEHLYPSIDTYRVNPTPENWALVKYEADIVLDYIKAATNSAVYYQTRLEDTVNDAEFKELHRVIFGRAKLMSQLPEGPMAPGDLETWITEYARVAGELAQQIILLRQRLQENPPSG